MSSRPSGLQRSRSSSCIPLPHRLSRPLASSSRGSIQKSRNKSVARPGQEKLSIDRNITRSSSNLNIDLSRLSRQRSGSLVRQATSTPLSVRVARKSPLLSSAKKDNRPISDKRWQYEQIVKVRNFVATEFPHLDYSHIKSGMPLECFVSLMDSYFKLIDKRLKVTRENYIEEVPANLKRYHYPANIKPSLMKTVNTPHSWPHVIAILSWLTDIIYEINCPIDTDTELESLADNCCMELYRQWNRYPDDNTENNNPLDELDLKLVRLLELDDNEFKKLEAEISVLTTETKAYEERKKQAMKKIDEQQDNLYNINGKCNTYLTEIQERENNLNDQCAKYTARIKTIDQELADFSKSEAEIKSVIASQPYSHIQKEQIAQEIKDLQNTFKLKEERSEQQRELIYKYDFKLSDIKQKVEASAYKYNNMINQLELYKPEFSKLRVRESGFARRDTEDEIHRIQKMLDETIKSLKVENEQYNKEMAELKKKQKEIDTQIATNKKEFDELSKMETEMEITFQHKKKKNNKEKEQRLLENGKYKKKLMDLKFGRCDLAPLKEELKLREERRIELLKFREDLKERALNFFVKLESQMSRNVQYYTNVMEEIASAMIVAQENAMSDVNNKIQVLKKTSEEVEQPEFK